MRKRLWYLLAFLILLAVEIYIGVFVQDGFVRGYVGDMLVTVLLCCLSRAVFPKLSPAVPVFALAVAVEGLQALGLTRLLGLEGSVVGIILGSTFDWRDIMCYALGCLAFAVSERPLRQ